MRRNWAILAALVLAGLAAYAGLWFEAARSVRQGLPAWAEARRAEGYALAWRSAEIEGFPLAFRLHLTGATLATAGPLPATAAAAELLLEAAPWNLHRWRFRAPEGARLEAPLGAVGIAAATLDGAVAEGEGGTVVTLGARDLGGTGLWNGLAADALDARLTLPPRGPVSERDMLFSLAAKLGDATVPQAPPPFARHIDELSVAATMKGQFAAAPLNRALAQWRDGGGTLDIDSARVAWGGTTIALSGTLALDEAMQPEGALTATIDGGDKLVDALVAAGAIEPGLANFAKAVMQAIATPGEDGRTAHVPVTVQDQRIYVGPAAIAALPHVTWR
jgi:hypothetical protein